MGLVIIVSVALMGTFVAAQQRFYRRHERWRGEWRSDAARGVTFPSGREFKSMLGATFRRAEDPTVERARRVYLAAMGAWIVWIFTFPLVIEMDAAPDRASFLMAFRLMLIGIAGFWAWRFSATRRKPRAWTAQIGPWTIGRDRWSWVCLLGILAGVLVLAGSDLVVGP